MCRGLFRRWDLKRRVKRGQKLVAAFKKELEQMVPILEKNKVTLGLENLPYLEGFPAEWEMKDLVGDWVKPWLDTGHDFVRRVNHWPSDAQEILNLQPPTSHLQPLGMHISDSQGGDDHLPPGEGRVDFPMLKTFAENARHVVFEPNSSVTEGKLKKGLSFLKGLWLS